MQAIPFDVESAITKGVYIKLRSRVEKLLNELYNLTKGFEEFSSDYIQANPYIPYSALQGVVSLFSRIITNNA
jgi:hypothetical protein